MTIDLHLDTLWKMTKYGGFQIAEGESYSDVNASSLTGGSLSAGVFALYLAHHLECDAERLVGEQISFFQQQKWPQGFKGYLAMEGGQLLQGKLENLEKYAKAGIVYLTLTHNYNNAIGCSATDEETGVGLTAFGEAVVKRCNELGVIVDISHTSFTTSMCAMAISTKPVIASHSGCKNILDHPRNLTDSVIRSVARTGGLIGVPFVKKFIGTRPAIVEHIDHIVQLVGIDHVAIGSDIDGAVMVDKVSMDEWWYAFAGGLAQLGYRSDAIEAVAGGNFMRLLEEIKS